MSREVVFVEGIRTAFGTLGKTMRTILGEEFAGMALTGLVEKSKIIEKGGVVDCVFMGSAIGPNTAINGARWPVLASCLPQSTSASYIEMQCGSGIDSINHAAWKIIAGQADIIIAGGYESYSNAPCRFPMTTEPYRMIPPHADCFFPVSHPRRGNDEHGPDGGKAPENVQHFAPGAG